MPVRSIAKALDMSTTTVQKYAMMCSEEPPPMPQQAEPQPSDETHELYYEYERANPILKAIRRITPKNST